MNGQGCKDKRGGGEPKAGSYLHYLRLSFLGGLLFLGIGLAAYRLMEERARRVGVDRKAV